MSLIELYGKKQNVKAAYMLLLSSLKEKNNKANYFLVVRPRLMNSSS